MEATQREIVASGEAYVDETHMLVKCDIEEEARHRNELIREGKATGKPFPLKDEGPMQDDDIVRLSSNLIELDSKTIKNRKRMMIFKYLFVLLYSKNKQKGIMARIGYARVSTTGQNLDMQIAALEKSNCDRIFVEKVSGVKERPELQAALKYMRTGDTLIVYKFDRIGRSLKDLVNIFADLQRRDITLISLKDNINATTNSGKFMMNVFAALAEFERTIIIERCQSGRAEAKRKGKKGNT